MLLIILIVTLSLLKYFEFSFMENLSWWWIGGLFFCAILWFEFFERVLGLDKKKAHEKFDNLQKQRAKKYFDKTKK